LLLLAAEVEAEVQVVEVVVVLEVSELQLLNH
jgi:hypothetical protein